MQLIATMCAPVRPALTPHITLQLCLACKSYGLASSLSLAPGIRPFSGAAQQPAQLGTCGNPLIHARARCRAGLRADQLRAHDVLPAGAAAGRPGGTQPWRSARHARPAQRLSACGFAPATNLALLHQQLAGFLPPAVPLQRRRMASAGERCRNSRAQCCRCGSSPQHLSGPCRQQRCTCTGLLVPSATASGVHHGRLHTRLQKLRSCLHLDRAAPPAPAPASEGRPAARERDALRMRCRKAVRPGKAAVAAGSLRTPRYERARRSRGCTLGLDSYPAGDWDRGPWQARFVLESPTHGPSCYSDPLLCKLVSPV